jgi:adenosylcobinamide-GDP ribazoletransferase
MGAFLGAVSFLTVIKISGKTVPPGKSAIFFPLVGALLGLAGAGIFLGASRALPVSLAALLTVAFWVGVSGVLHEDGLADVADAFRAERSRDKMFAILKDSRIGTFGAVAIVFSVIVRWQALEHLATPRVIEVCIASQAVPRAAMVALAWVSRPVGTGLGLAFSSTLSTPAALAAIVQAGIAAFACGLEQGAIILFGGYFILRAARAYCYRRIGGVNGDCLGATEQIFEMLILILFTTSSWPK